MEDGDISEMEVSASIKAAESNDLLNKMANYPDVEVTVIKNNKNSADCKTSDNSTKVNGESEKVNSCYSDDQEEFSSDDDALIIDEDIKSVETKPSVNNKRFRSPSPRANFKGFKKRIIEKSYHSLKIVNEIKKFYLFDDKEDLLNHKEESNKQGELNNATITKDSITQCLVNDSDNKTGTRDNNCTLTNQKLKKTLTAASTTHIESLKHKQHVNIPSLKSSGKRPVKKRPSQKLTEYAQYLGLQPAVKFKCVKCSESSFPSLSALNEHQRQCLVQPQSNTKTTTTTTTTPTGQSLATTTTVTTTPSSSTSSSSFTSVPPASTATSSTNFRVTRKVFLCSSCGTYYENCNLFLHMREVHRRYICLYCLGMFSLPEKLSHHLVTKHNCSPNHYSSAEDFLSSYSESCFLVCCHCERVFSERDNFYEHVCAEKRIKLTDPPCWSCGIKDSSNSHSSNSNSVHLPTCRANIDQPPSTSTHSNNNNNSQNQKQTSKSSSIHPKSQKHKTIKSTQKTAIAPVQHVTADSASTSLENENDKTGGHFLADMNFCKNILTENMSETTNPQENTDLNENSTKENVADMETCDNNDDDEKEKTNDINTEITNNDETKTLETNENKELTNIDSCTDNLVEMKNDSIINDLEKSHSDAECPESEKMDIPENKDTSETTNATTPIAEINVNVDLSQNIADVKNDDDLDENGKEETVEKSDNDSKESSNEKTVVVEDTRKVPKVTLKLPPQSLIYSENESDDSEKLTMEVDAVDDSDNDNDCDESLEHSKSFNECGEKPVNGIEDDGEKNNSDLNQSDDDSFQVAGDEVSIIELELDQPLDKFHIEDLIKTCLSATIATCIYCNHARKIAVNGKQLGLHAIAEHRFSATVNSITAEELIPKNFVQRIKEGLDEIEFVYFSLVEQEKVQEDGSLHVNTFKHSYECFQCRFVTSIHKELYLHNRKMHAKTILLCIMCKSNFYSYSELICHLCPGNYVLNSETKFRCCMCDSNNLPSAFRLMVHLRKKHHTCDVCLEGCHNQSKLSNHVWKHKLHHLCYRCGIAYRNKPDITKHLFWKHGTESVLCKKCLQKKWPHVYHFCVPPLSFVCEECNLSFSKAVYLKVHKRLHINEKPHACPEENCGETFISKKLLLKHELKHREPIPIETCDEPVKQIDVNAIAESKIEEKAESTEPKESTEATKEDTSIVNEPGSPEKEETKQKSIIDVYDLPALNLSESDSDSEEEKPKAAITTAEASDEKSNIAAAADDEKPENLPNILPAASENAAIPIEEEQKPVPILDGIWDNFKNYQATIEKNILNTELSSKEEKDDNEKLEENIPDINVILADHDYCLPQPTKDEEDDMIMKTDETTGLDHDYCTVSSVQMPNPNKVRTNSASTDIRPKTPDATEKKKVKTPKKKSSSSSDSSSDSDSSSCTCGSNCSCSSSSGSSSSSSSSSDSDSSSSEGKRRIAARRERRKERAKRKKESETSNVTNTSAVDVVATEDPVVPIPPIEVPIQESDLETDETETDEDFYDEYPQRLVNKILAEKRNQLALLASVAPVSNGTILECSRPSTPSMPEESTVPKKKVKSKKRKKKSRSSTPKQEAQQHNIPDYLNHRHSSSPMQVAAAPSTQPAVPSPLSIHSIPPTPQIQTVPPLSLTLPPKSQILSHQSTPGSGSETETSVRSSKRRRVPNKFYGYSSDEDANEKSPAIVTPVLKWRKADLPTPPSHVTGSPQLVPPITIKNIPSPAPVVEPVRMAPVIIHHQHRNEAPPESDSETEEVLPQQQQQRKSATDSSEDNRNDDSDSDAGQLHISQPQAQLQSHSQPRPPPAFPSGPGPRPHHSMAGFKQGERNENLYCYCQCPYDEVSEMIACDGKDCAIEWFHFECVGIMVPPKGKWFCPDCRKRNTQRSDFIQI